MEIPGCCCEVSDTLLSVMGEQDVQFLVNTENSVRHSN